MEKNCLFYVQTISETEELRELQHSLINAGWQLKCVSDISDLDHLSSQHKELICIYAFDKSNISDVEKIEKLTIKHALDWIALTHQDFLANTIHRELLAKYFFDYHTFPYDPTRVGYSLGHALGMAHLKKNIHHLTVGKDEQLTMIGKSSIMKDLFYNIRKASTVDVPILISGESGTGKELVAKAIHESSSRRKKQLITLNCGAISPELVHSELFGYEKGAFTGASCRTIGRIEAANNGTLFLDEIGDLPLSLQANLLRFLQEGTIERVGGVKTIHVDVRVVAASHVNLKESVKQGAFREDLYYRLHVLNIHSPALRERGDDVLALAEHVFKLYQPKINKRVLGFSKSSRKALCLYTWPGNVRELSNRIIRAITMCEGRLIYPRDLCLTDKDQSRFDNNSLSDVRECAERNAIYNRLKAFDNNVSQVAKNLSVSRVTLYRLLKKYDIPLTENIET